MDKWISDKSSRQERLKREKVFKSLSEGEIKELKKKTIRDIAKQEEENVLESSGYNNIIDEILKFKEWINQRTYLQGDIDKIETWIKNLYLKIQAEPNRKEYSNTKKKIVEQYKIIPPTLLDEKTRVAINKKIHGTKRTNSDNYYLRKLKKTVQEKLIESKYYKILNKILNLL